MKIYRKFTNEDQPDIQEISLERAIELTEGRGHYKPDTVENLLFHGTIVWTPYSEFAKSPELLKDGENK